MLLCTVKLYTNSAAGKRSSHTDSLDWMCVRSSRSIVLCTLSFWPPVCGCQALDNARVIWNILQKSSHNSETNRGSRSGTNTLGKP